MVRARSQKDCAETAAVPPKTRAKAMIEIIAEGRAAIACGDFTRITSDQDLDRFFERVRRRASDKARQ